MVAIICIPLYGGIVVDIPLYSQSTKAISKQKKRLGKHFVTFAWTFSRGYS